MVPYFILFGIISFLLFLFKLTNNNKYKTILLLIILFTLVFFGGFRDSVGIDTLQYIALYKLIMPFGQNFHNSVLSIDTELGFLYLIGLLKTIGLFRVQSLFSLVIIFNYTLYFFSLKRLTPKFEIALILLIVFYYFTRDMGIIRQAISTSITVFSIITIYERKFLKFSSLILIASLFHISSLVFLPAYFIGQIKISKSGLFFLLFVGFLSSFIPTNIKNSFFSFLTFTDLPFLNDPVFGTPISFFSLTFIRRLIPAILIFIFYDKITANIKNSLKIINLYIFGLFFSIVFIDLAIYITRLFIFYLILDVLIYSYIFVIIKFKTIKFIYGLFLLLVCIIFILNYMGSPPWLMTPYDNIILNWK